MAVAVLLLYLVLKSARPAPRRRGIYVAEETGLPEGFEPPSGALLSLGKAVPDAENDAW